MSPDLTTPPINSHADAAAALLKEVAGELPEDVAAAAAVKAVMAQAHATLAAAQETRAAAYDHRTAAYVAYFATLAAGTHADKQHAAVIDDLIRKRLNFIPTEGTDSHA
jgi:fructose-1,6-bisphosphatase/sedoheptulose 1,7-bisphosphatase-like protein